MLSRPTSYSYQILMKLEFYEQIFEKHSNIIYHENPSIGSTVVPCRRTDMTKTIIINRSFAHVPKWHLNNT